MPAKLAVQHGVHAGRAVVTAAAIIMTSVFSGFVFSDSSTIRPIGFGLACGVLVDAFIVRMLLIPAVMRLLGNAAWWFPEWSTGSCPTSTSKGRSWNERTPRSSMRQMPRTWRRVPPIRWTTTREGTRPRAAPDPVS